MAIQRRLWSLCRAGLIIALMVSLGIVAARAATPEKPQVAGYEGNRVPLLIEPDSLAHWGKVAVPIPVRPIEKGEPTAPSFLTGWEEAYYTALDITSSILGQYSVGIFSHSYEFTSSATARAALQSLPDPRNFGWLSEQPSLLDPAVAKLLDDHSFRWRLWYGVDSEGLPTHILWLQSGPYLAEIYIFAAVPTFHKNLAAGDAFSSEAEQKKEYMEILQSKLKQGLTCDDWLDLQSSQSLAQQVLNDVAQKLAERIK